MFKRFRGKWSWWIKQYILRPSRFYGDGGTIHSTNHLDVETREGKVVSVWFRCCMLPFEQHEVDMHRVQDMRKYSNKDLPAITGINLLDKKGK